MSKGHWREKATRDGQKAATLQQFHAVYVYGPLDGRPAKIGIAENPNKRCHGIQGGYWQPCKIWRYWWTLGRVMAYRLEQCILSDHSEVRLTGEWLNLGAEELMARVEPTAARLRIRLFDDEEAVRLAFAYSRSEQTTKNMRYFHSGLENRKHL